MIERPELLIRADASTEMGTGHIMRCLALAQAWQDAGGTARFASHQLPASLAERLQQEGVFLEQIEACPGSTEDFHQLVAISNRLKSTAVVVDGYQFRQVYVDSVSALNVCTLLIDDYGQLSDYRTKFVLNQNAGADEQLYSNHGPQTQLLLGPTYALIRRELRRAEERDRGRDGTVRRILVTLGGSDPANITEMVMRGLMAISATGLQFRVIVGGLNDHVARLRELATQDSRFEVLQSVKNMSQHYGWADVAIAAGGSSNWEMCSFSLPRLILVLADNQRSLSCELARIGGVLHLAEASSLSWENLAENMRSILGQQEAVVESGMEAGKLVDGDGATRCCDAIIRYQAVASVLQSTLSNPSYKLTLRPAREDDWQLLLTWRNNALTRATSRNGAKIDPASHRLWLSDCLRDPQRILFVAEVDGVAVGTFRIDPGAVQEVSWTVAPEARGCGVGTGIVKLGISALNVPLRAVIREENVASQRIARSAGFERESQIGNFISFIRHPAQG